MSFVLASVVMSAMLYGEQVVRIRRTQSGVDRYGSPVYVTTETPLPDGAGFDPGGSVEPAEVGRESVVTTPKLYFWAATPDLRADDSVRVRGRVFMVVGNPASWVNPFTGWQAGLVVELTETEG